MPGPHDRPPFLQSVLHMSVWPCAREISQCNIQVRGCADPILYATRHLVKSLQSGSKAENGTLDPCKVPAVVGRRLPSSSGYSFQNGGPEPRHRESLDQNMQGRRNPLGE